MTERKRDNGKEKVGIKERGLRKRLRGTEKGMRQRDERKYNTCREKQGTKDEWDTWKKNLTICKTGILGGR